MICLARCRRFCCSASSIRALGGRYR